MSAIELLIEYAKLRKKILRLMSQMEELKSQAESLSAWTDGDRVQSSHDPDKIGRVIARLADKQDECCELMIEAIDRMNEIEAILNDLDNPDYSLVLQYKYIRGLTWDEVAENMYCTPRWAMILRDRALRAMDKIINDNIRQDAEIT